MNHDLRSVLTAWKACPASADWPMFVDTVSTADWRGRRIAWLAFEGECFDIFCVHDSSVVTHDDLPSYIALNLDWDIRHVGRMSLDQSQSATS